MQSISMINLQSTSWFQVKQEHTHLHLRYPSDALICLSLGLHRKLCNSIVSENMFPHV